MPVDMQDAPPYADTRPAQKAVRAILDSDPVWAAYAIADLQSDYAPFSHWCIGRGATEMGLTLLFTRLSPPALFAMGDPDGVARAIEAAHLPDKLYMTLREEHYAVASRYYDFSADRRPMWRMALRDPSAVSKERQPPAGFSLRALDAGDTGGIRRLYANGGSFAPDAFDGYQTEDGTFFGVVDGDGEILAAGGTHVVDWQAGVGAIGNMYTHPAHRGQGLGAAVLQAIVGCLVAGGATNIILNVDERNADARRLYERHGFEAYCPYLEGPGHTRSKVESALL